MKTFIETKRMNLLEFVGGESIIDIQEKQYFIRESTHESSYNGVNIEVTIQTIGSVEKLTYDLSNDVIYTYEGKEYSLDFFEGDFIKFILINKEEIEKMTYSDFKEMLDINLFKEQTKRFF